MRLTYLQTDFPNGRSHILLKNTEFSSTELVHFILVLSKSGRLWVDVFWPYDEDAENLTYSISEQQFWRLFREWRLNGLFLGDSEKVATVLAKKQLDKKRSPLQAKKKSI